MTLLPTGPRALITRLAYLSVVLLTAATSFTGRISGVQVAAEKHRAGWTLFAHHGQPETLSELEDINIVSYARRPLLPGLVNAVSATVHLGWPYAFELVRLASIVLALVAFRRWLLLWLDETGALLGTFYLAAALPLTFATNAWEILSDFPELLVSCLGLMALHSGNALAMTAIVFVGALNRETAGLLAVVAVMDRLVGRQTASSTRCALGALVGWSLAWLALRSWMTLPVQVGAYPTTWAHNARGLATLLSKPHPYNNFLFPLYLLGFCWLAPFTIWRQLPPLLRSTALVAPAFLVVIVVLGGLNEPRQLMPLFPMLVPAALLALASQRTPPFEVAPLPSVLDESRH